MVKNNPIEHPYSQRIDEANEYLEHNNALEQSPDFQKIESEVEKEVYTQFALDGIRDMELYLARGGED